jgi:hypothetical protein
MNKNIDYFLLDSTSSEKNELIKSKIEKYKTVSEFFEHYSNNNIISLFDSFNRLDKIYSNIYFNNNNNIKSKIDKYISDLSNIILLYNLISKNQQIIKKALTNSESYLKNFYSENHINKDCQKKLDDYFDNLINLKKRKKKKRLSFLTRENIFNKCQRHKTVKARKPNIFNLNKKLDEKSININYKLINISPTNHLSHIKHNSIDEEKSNLRTPKFPSKNEDPNNNSQSFVKENDSNKVPIIKQESINSFFTLASKAANINSDENRIKKIKKDKKVKINDQKVTNFNLQNIQNDSEAKLVYTKSNFSENKKSQDNSEEFEKKEYYTKKNPKKQTFSSVNLKTTMEKNMLKDFLGFINNIYKSGSINTEEKIKLKQLIISKSEKIENIYNNYYHHNKNEFINEIKKLIIQ